MRNRVAVFWSCWLAMAFTSAAENVPPELKKPANAPNQAALALQVAAILDRNSVIYRIPTERGEDGLPIGNGDIGSMFWTPTNEGGLALQLNKVDAFSAGCNTKKFWATNTLPSCGRIVIKPARSPQVGASEFYQKLLIADGLASVKAAHLDGEFSATAFVHAQRPCW